MEFKQKFKQYISSSNTHPDTIFNHVEKIIDTICYRDIMYTKVLLNDGSIVELRFYGIGRICIK